MRPFKHLLHLSNGLMTSAALLLGTFCSPLHSIVIDRVILSCNNDPLYIEFWPVVAPLWQAMGIRPTLALIGDEDCVVDETLGDVIRFDPIPGVPESLHSQAIRLFLPCLFPEDGCIISDIDMIPILKDYYVDGAAFCPDEGFVVFRDKVEHYCMHKYPMCYIAAKGKIFGSVFSVSNKEEIEDRILDFLDYDLGWNTDELLLYQFLDEWEKKGGNLVKLGYGLGPRLDRGNWKLDFLTLKVFDYIDCHCPRPYSSYRESIDFIAKSVQLRYDTKTE